MRYELWLRGEVAPDLPARARAGGVGCDAAHGGVDLWVAVETGPERLDHMLDLALAGGADVFDPQGGGAVLAGDREAVRRRFSRMTDALVPAAPAALPSAEGGPRLLLWLALAGGALWILTRLLRWAAT